MTHTMIHRAIYGPIAERPDAANPFGAAAQSPTPLYVTSDTGEIFQSTGSAWVKLGNVGSQATSIQVGGGTILTEIQKLSAALTPASVAANTSAEQTFTVTGLATTDAVYVNKPTAQAGLAIGNVRVSATNTLAITFVNDTASPITPASETYLVVAIRS